MLGDGFSLLGRHWRVLFIVAALVALPAALLNELVYTLVPEPGASFEPGDVTGLLLPLPLSYLVSVIPTGIVVYTAVERGRGADPDWEQGLTGLLHRLVPLLALAVLIVVVVMAGLIMLIVPGIFFTVALSAAIPVFVAEARGPVASLRRSLELVRGRWWPVAGVVVIAALIAFAISAVFGGWQLATSSVSVAGRVITATLSSAVALPITAALTAAMYFQLVATR